MNSIQLNHKWLFDGVLGATVVALAGWFLNRLLTRSKPQVATGSNINPTVNRTEVIQSPASHVRDFHPDPAPENILDRINGALPSHRNAMAESFRGLPVRWRGRLAGASALEGAADIYDLAFKPDTQSSQQSINCRANISTNPRLKISNGNDLWEVSGFIDSISKAGSLIDLRDVQISYVGPSPG